MNSLFTGEYRKKPIQSLKGASKSDTKDDLLEKNRRQRQLRERLRQEEEAATRIQAFYRGSQSRRLTQSLTRQKFDEVAVSFGEVDGGDSFCSWRDRLLFLAKCLNNFYLPHLDKERISQLCSMYIQRHSELDLSGQSIESFTLSKFLSNVSCHVGRLEQNCQQRHCQPLRALELALPTASNCVRQYLCSKGYFAHLSAFLAGRPGVSDATDVSDARRQPLIESIIRLIILPLMLDGGECLLSDFIQQCLCSSQLPWQLQCQLLASALATAVAERQFSLGQLLDSAELALARAERLVGLLAFLVNQLPGLHRLGERVNEGARLLSLLRNCCCRELPQLSTDCQFDSVLTGLQSDWLPDMLKATLSCANHQQAYVDLSSLYWCLNSCGIRTGLTLYSLTSASNRASFLENLWSAVRDFQWRGANLTRQVALGSQPPPPALGLAALHPLLFTFGRLFSHEPLSSSALVELSAGMRDILLGLLLLSHPDTRPDLLHGEYSKALRSLAVQPDPSDVASSRDLLRLYARLFASVKPIVSRLYTMHLLRPFAELDDNHWSVRGRIPPIRSLRPDYWLQREPDAAFGYYSVLNDQVSIPYLSSAERLQLAVLTEAPYLIDFWDRVRLLYSLLQAYKSAIQYDRHEFGHGGIRVTARRDKVYEDAFSQLYSEPSLHPRIRVQFRNEHGLEEAGIDGGGLMREFLALVLSAAFDPERGFYSQTAGGCLYPNPLSASISDDCSAHYYFHGRLLGKLLFERLLIDLPLAPFFLRRIIVYACPGRDTQQRAAASVEELQELDPELYKNVSALSSVSATELESMELDFSLLEDRLGRSEPVELRPGGGCVRVTPDNVGEYQQLLADYKLRIRLAKQTQAFANGLASVVPCPDWLAFFSHKELQLLISGSDSPIDVLDLRRHTAYQGCDANSDTVAGFWRLMLDEFNEKQRRAVLRFVTSLTRAPLYGWSELHPPFTIGLVPEPDRLPTASTCVNLLKLPDYRNQALLRERLLLAIESNTGFELS